ncbi:uncharacterized protein O3C94_023654 [Discoglossus pictus]
MKGVIFLAVVHLSFALNKEEKNRIVEKHNFYRSQVDFASDMIKLTWDTTLEELAKSYSKKCIWEHNKERGFRGENLFVMTGPTFDAELGLEDWHREVEDYDFTYNNCTEGKMCGHYTQMVWASTERVGCGYHLCETMEGYEETNVHFLVCNYEPPGNFQGRQPYKEGSPCSECPSDTNCSNSLCEKSIIPEEDHTGLPDLSTTPSVSPEEIATEQEETLKDVSPTITQQTLEDVSPTITQQTLEDVSPTITQQTLEDVSPTITQQTLEDVSPPITSQPLEDASPPITSQPLEYASPAVTPQPIEDISRPITPVEDVSSPHTSDTHSPLSSQASFTPQVSSVPSDRLSHDSTTSPISEDLSTPIQTSPETGATNQKTIDRPAMTDQATLQNVNSLVTTAQPQVSPKEVISDQPSDNEKKMDKKTGKGEVSTLNVVTKLPTVSTKQPRVQKNKDQKAKQDSKMPSSSKQNPPSKFNKDKEQGDQYVNSAKYAKKLQQYAKALKLDYKPDHSDMTSFGNNVFRSHMPQAKAKYCPYPCTQQYSMVAPLYRTKQNPNPTSQNQKWWPVYNSVMKPRTKRPCKTSGFSNRIYNLYRS